MKKIITIIFVLTMMTSLLNFNVSANILQNKATTNISDDIMVGQYITGENGKKEKVISVNEGVSFVTIVDDNAKINTSRCPHKVFKEIGRKRVKRTILKNNNLCWIDYYVIRQSCIKCGYLSTCQTKEYVYHRFVKNECINCHVKRNH